jgi:ferredoxin
MEQLELLKDTAETISIASLCALGKTAPNPVLSTLKYFENEYKAHIIDKKCPAKVCKDLIEYKINEKCIGCGVCLKACPVNAITGDKKKMHAIDINKCTKCGICMDSCKFSAIAVS